MADAAISESWRCNDRALALRDEAFIPARGPTSETPTPVATLDPRRPMTFPGDRGTITTYNVSMYGVGHLTANTY
jgi:hypothetical protein